MIWEFFYLYFGIIAGFFIVIVVITHILIVIVVAIIIVIITYIIGVVFRTGTGTGYISSSSSYSI